MSNNVNQSAGTNSKSNPPTHVAKVRHGQGKNASYERIGVAWLNEEGAVYVKLHGTQVVSAFTLYELPQTQTDQEQPAS